MSSLTTNSIVHVIAYVATVGMGLVYSVVTARWLGPANKGILATLTFLFVVFSELGTVGLGEAAIVLVGQNRASLQRALSATVAALIVTTLAATAALSAAALLTFRANLSGVSLAIVASCLVVPIYVYLKVLTHIVNAQERFIATSVVLFVQAAVAAVVTSVLVIVWPLSVLGGVLGLLSGFAVGLLAIIWLLTRRSMSLRPVWDGDFIRQAMPFGLKVLVSGPPPLTDRADLLLVYGLAGQAAAGRYSIALTVGTLVGMVPLTLSHVSFPRLARLTPLGANELTARTCRFGLAAAVLIASIFALTVPVILPLVFGAPYAPAIVPVLILLVGFTLSSAQWLLGRASAARGNAALLIWSYGANLAMMVALDYALIPRWDISGAAVASVGGTIVGLTICLYPLRRHDQRFLGLTDFLPTAKEFRQLLSLPRQLIVDRTELGNALFTDRS